MDKEMQRALEADGEKLRGLTGEDHGPVFVGAMSWDEFEEMLIKNGWTPEDAKREREAQEHGDLGDCDGDMSLA
jgi:hypothetical protein